MYIGYHNILDCVGRVSSICGTSPTYIMFHFMFFGKSTLDFSDSIQELEGR